MRVKIFISIMMLIWFISCSFEDPAEDITFENYKFNIPFDNERFDFDTLDLEVDLDPIAFPESLKVAPIRDSTSQDFNDFVIKGGTRTKYVQYDDGAIYNPGVNIPAVPYQDSIVGIPGNAQFLCANTDSMIIKFSVENNYQELIFDSLNFVFLRQDTTFTNVTDYPNGNREIIDVTFYDYQPNTTKEDSILLDRAWITKDMTLLVTAYNQELLPADNTVGLDANQDLYFVVEVGDCRFHSAFANFNNQVDNQTDTYSRGDITEYGNIKLRSIILREFLFSVDARNETDLYVEIDGQVDNFYDLKEHPDSLVNIDKFHVDPDTTVYDVTGPYELDSCAFFVNFDDQSATVTHDSWGMADSNSADYPYVQLGRFDSISFYFEIESRNPGQNYVPFYEIDALVENEKIEIFESTTGFAEDIDWDEWNGVNFNMLNLKADASFSRDSLIMDMIILENFQMIGVKEGIPDPDGWVNLKDTILTEFNNGILDLTEVSGGNTFTEMINYRPDEIQYRADVTMTHNGVIKYNDKLNLDLIISTPIELEITDSLRKEFDVIEVDRMLKDFGSDSEMLNLYLNSFINNPNFDLNAVIKLTMLISDEAVEDVANDSSLVLTGDIKKIFDLEITENPGGPSDDGYFIYELDGNNFDENGLNLLEYEPEIFNMMKENDTYLQPVITIYPVGTDPITISADGYVEVQTSISGEANLSTGGEDE